MKLRNNVKEIAKENKISLLSLSEKFNVTYAQMHKFANNKQERIKSISAQELADALGCDVSEIFYIE